MPVVVQACFELIPLPRESCIQSFRAGDRMRPAPGQPDGRPDRRPRRIRHLHGPVQVIDVHHEQRGRCVHARDDGHGAIDNSPGPHRWGNFRLRQPDVLAHRRARRVEFRDHIPEHIMNRMHRAVGRARVRDHAFDQLLEAVVEPAPDLLARASRIDPGCRCPKGCPTT